jgi:hypothetical protein
MKNYHHHLFLAHLAKGNVSFCYLLGVHRLSSVNFSHFNLFGHAISEKIFKNRSIRNKNCLWQPCLLMNRDKMSNP